MENRPMTRPLAYSAFFHALLLLVFFFLLGPFFKNRAPLMMELTLIGQMSQGEGLGSTAASPGREPDQAPQARTEGEMASPEKRPSNPRPRPAPKPKVALHKPLPSQKYSGSAPSEAYLQSLDKEAPIGLAVHKDATDQIKTTAGLGHLGVAGSPDGEAKIEGELAARAVKTKVYPKYPDWARRQGVEGSVRFRLTVLPNGLLKDDLELDQTSGYQQLDRVVYEALIQWEFTPLPPSLPQVDQSGTITFSFDLKDGATSP